MEAEEEQKEQEEQKVRLELINAALRNNNLNRRQVPHQKLTNNVSTRRGEFQQYYEGCHNRTDGPSCAEGQK